MNVSFVYFRMFHTFGMFQMQLLEVPYIRNVSFEFLGMFHTLGMFHLQFVENTKTGADEYMYFHIINTLRSINIFHIAN
jgi:hypothetical protein